MAREGCLIGYAPDLVALRRLTGDFVQRIFGGDDPGQLPFHQPDRFRLVINLKVAAQLQIELPLLILARADEVIE